MRVSAIQMVSSTQLQSNLDSAHELLRAAAKEGAELALLPDDKPVPAPRDRIAGKGQEPYGGEQEIHRCHQQHASDCGRNPRSDRSCAHPAALLRQWVVAIPTLSRATERKATPP